MCAALNFSSVSHFNASVGQPPELPSLQANHDAIQSRISRPTTVHLMAVRQTVDSRVDHWLEGVGELLGIVLMDCSNEVAGLGPLVVGTSVQSRGVGRALTQRCMEEAKQRGVQSVRLQQVVANVASFSLYHSLGFRACEYMVALQGHVSAAHHKRLGDEMQADGINIKAMERDNIAVCNQLHVATNSVSRLAGIVGSFDLQPSQQQKVGGAQPNCSTAAPTVGCYVAVNAGGGIVGYCTGWGKASH